MAVLDVVWRFEVQGKRLNELGRSSMVRFIELIGRVVKFTLKTMLTNEDCVSRWGGLGSSKAFKVLYARFNDFAANSIDFDINIIGVEAMTIDCEYLTASLIAFNGTNRIYLGNSFSLVALCVVVGASLHGVIHM
jgi:hypothetical protein